jgi:hypothetical protein
LSEISRLSGVTVSRLNQDPAFRVLPPYLDPIREQVPQREGEKNQAYARRLRQERPQLTRSEISQLSGVPVCTLKRDPALLSMPRPRKRPSSEAAAAQPASQEIEAIRNVRPRLNEPSGAPIQQLLQAPQRAPAPSGMMFDLNEPWPEPEQANDGRPPSELAPLHASGPIKREVSAMAPRPHVPVLVETPLDQARTAFYEELEECDLTADAPQWTSTLAKTGGVIVHHRMEPVPGNDDKFPLRDLKNPARAHPRYAGDDGKCHRKVALKKIKLDDKDAHEFLQDLCASDARLHSIAASSRQRCRRSLPMRRRNSSGSLQSSRAPTRAANRDS